MIFQDPMMTLNPVLRIDTQMVETVQAHRKIKRDEAVKLAVDALAQVGIPSPERRLKAYPHELSGGMRQRVAIATAFINQPDLIIADEPTTALDVTIQAQILFEAQQLCRKTGTAMIWITHDLAVVAALADRIAVMYAGRIVEHGNGRRCHRSTTASLHGWPLGLRAKPQQARPAPDPDPGHDAIPAQSSRGLRVSHALSPCRCRLHASAPDMSSTASGRGVRCFHPLITEAAE